MSASKTNALSQQAVENLEENSKPALVKNFLFTSESVSEGHPDKVADQISDAVLDAHLKEDPKSRVAIETLIKSSMVVLAGEITSTANVHYEKVVRDTLEKIGYTSEAAGCDHNRAVVLLNISKQSPDIAQGVNENEGAFDAQGAGDQGLMFGFACDETPEFMPLPAALSHRLVSKLAEHRHSGKVDYLRPDSKSQVTVLYKGFQPIKVDTIVLSSQHTPEVSQEELEEFIKKEVISSEVPSELIDSETKILINPTGRFVSGGPDADCGLTGRKIIVDTYGGYGRHGGGAFSGKDPSKVDRSAAYAARYIAKNIVASGIAKRCEIQLAYAIGVAEPVSILVDTFGTGAVSDEDIAAKAKEVFDFRPKGIIKQLGLDSPIYQGTASYGHFGRKPDSAGKGSFSWERVDLAKEFAKLS